jgi:tRNA A22 N-methylase
MKRLDALYSLIEPGRPLWDIGCDHGLLGIRALQEELVPEAHFVDSARPVIDRLENVIPNDLKSRSHLRKTKAEALNWSQVKGTVVLAGLGSNTIAKIIKSIPPSVGPNIKLVLSSERGDIKPVLKNLGWSVESEVRCPQGPRFRIVISAAFRGALSVDS